MLIDDEFMNSTLAMSAAQLVTVETEPNDTILTAIDTGLSSTNPGTFTLVSNVGNNTSIAPSADVDFFQVQLNVNDKVTIDVDALDLPLNAYLRIFDSAGNELAFNDDALAPGELPPPGQFFTLDPYLTFTATTPGTYYIGVSSSYNGYYSPFIEGSGSGYTTGNYSINITVTPPKEIFGTSGSDILIGTDDADIISGLEGNDTILSRAGNDIILGGIGDDFVNAGEGNDTIDAGAGNDVIFGGDGIDTITGGDGIDVIYGDNDNGFSYFINNDQISGGEGDDRIFSGSGDDQVNGDNGDDLMDGGDGFDTISGDNGNDRIFGGFGSDQLLGGVGDDQINGGFDFDLLEGGDGNDVLFGDSEGDTLNGGVGEDILWGGTGFDSLNGGDGNDLIIGVDPFNPAPGNGFYYFGEIDTLTGGSGQDTFVLGSTEFFYYNDGNSATSGDSDYALIADLNVNEDFIQLKGTANLYSLDFFTSSTGSLNAAIVYDPGITARGEVIGVVQGAATDLSITAPCFTFV